MIRPGTGGECWTSLPVVVHGAAAVLPMQHGSAVRLDEGDAELCRPITDRDEVDHPQAGEDTGTNPDSEDTGAHVGGTGEAI